MPEGRFKISRRVYESAKAVNSPQRAADADAIAGFLKSLAGDVESGKTRGVSQIREQYNSGMATKFNAEQKANWLGFSAVVGRIIYDLLQSGALGTWQDWVDLLLEIAAALELVL